MHGLLKQPGYRLYPPEQPRGGGLARGAAPRPHRPRAGSRTPRKYRGSAIRPIVGINEDGLFGVTRADWRPDLPNALYEPFIPLLWLKVHELLGRVPEGSTGRGIRDGTLPDETQGDGTVYPDGHSSLDSEAPTA